MVVGYDDSEQCFIVKNSWSTDWGEAGFSRIAYTEIGSPVEFNSITYFAEAGMSRISGRVTNPIGDGIKDVRVMESMGSHYDPGATVYTDSDGNFHLELYPYPQIYKVFIDGSSKGYVSEWYNNKPDFESADVIALVAGKTLEMIVVLTPPKISSTLITFDAIKTSYKTLSDTTGCPSGFVGKFSFDARLTNKSDNPSHPSLSDLIVEVKTLTNGNLLQNADGGPGGVGATLTVPKVGAYSDGELSSGEFVDVPFVICLKQKKPFSFFVDVWGIVAGDLF